MIIVMPRDLSDHPDRVYMSEISREIGRSRETIITWDTSGRLPERLAFKRDRTGWRYWTRAQLELAKEWVNSPEHTAPIRGRHKSKTTSAT